MVRFARMWVLGAGLGLVASLGGGCPAEATLCISDDDCDEGGQCEPGGACSVPDGECETGRRYAEDAPSGRAGRCVEGFGTTTGATPPPYEEPNVDDDDDSGADTSIPEECPTIMPGPEFELFAVGQYVDGTVMPPLGEVEQPDALWLEIYEGISGSFPVDTNYASCQHCIFLSVDGETQYLATEGEMTVDVADEVGMPTVISLSGIRLEEVVLAGEPIETTFVENGSCVRLEDTEAISVDWWTCPPGFFGGDDGCDCGCGVVDPDCADPSALYCEFCVDESCGAPDCQDIDPDDNSVCTEPVWTCDESLLGDGSVCHCGCGLVDSDCVSTAVGSCDVCDAMGSCVPPEANGECEGQIHPERNWQCTPVPGWTCSIFSYGDGLCDCGCGGVDIDCEDGQPCEVCDAAGSCSAEMCPGTIDPMDTTSCVPMG